MFLRFPELSKNRNNKIRAGRRRAGRRRKLPTAAAATPSIRPSVHLSVRPKRSAARVLGAKQNRETYEIALQSYVSQEYLGATLNAAGLV